MCQRVCMHVAYTHTHTLKGSLILNLFPILHFTALKAVSSECDNLCYFTPTPPILSHTHTQKKTLLTFSENPLGAGAPSSASSLCSERGVIAREVVHTLRRVAAVAPPGPQPQQDRPSGFARFATQLTSWRTDSAEGYIALSQTAPFFSLSFSLSLSLSLSLSAPWGCWIIPPLFPA